MDALETWGANCGRVMLPSNRKMWCMPLEQLDTYWLYKLPDVAFCETLQRSLIVEPRRGPSERWLQPGANKRSHQPIALAQRPADGSHKSNPIQSNTKANPTAITVPVRRDVGAVDKGVGWPSLTGVSSGPLALRVMKGCGSKS